jgi:hypothetical protein
MKPVTQTRTGVPAGNCTEACIASILEVGLEEVPDLYDAASGRAHVPERWQVLCDWLRSRGYLWAWGKFAPRSLPTTFEAAWGESGPDDWLLHLHWGGYHLLGGPNPDGLPHCVVARGGEVVWDPNPSRRGIVHADAMGILAPLVDLPEDVRGWPGIGIGGGR